MARSKMDNPELATLEDDFWTLESVLERHAKSPKEFWIPSEEQRMTLKKGSAAKLLFMLEGEDEDGEAHRGCEQMWVIVLSSNRENYFGILDNEPDCIEPEDGVLQRGSKLWFKPEHVINLGQPPLEYLEVNYPDEFAT